MPTLVPSRRRPPGKPHAWRAGEPKSQLDWKCVGFLAIGVLAAAGLSVGLLFASGMSGPQTAAKATPTIIVARDLISSSVIGNTPVATATPLAVTPLPPVGATQLSPSTEPAFSPAPPAQVQQVTPARPPGNAPTTAATIAGSPAASLPGNLVPAGAAAPRTTPTATAAALDSSIANDLYSINARATSLARAASALSGSGSPTPPSSGTPRPAPTDTPIPTAAPPIPPQA